MTHQLNRLGELIATVGGTATSVGVSPLSSRFELIVPYSADALAKLAPRATAPTNARMIRVASDGERTEIAVVQPGPPTPTEESVLAPLVALGGIVLNRNSYVTDDRSAVTLVFQHRDRDAEAPFARAIEEHFTRLGIPSIRRALWKNVYRTSGVGRVLQIKTTFAAGRPVPLFAASDDHTSLDKVNELLVVLTGAKGAATATERLREITTKLDVDEMFGTETVLGMSTPDLLVWLALIPVR